MNTTIRLALAADAAALAELAARTFKETFAADNAPEDMALHVARAYGPLQQGRELADPNVTTLLVTGVAATGVAATGVAATGDAATGHAATGDAAAGDQLVAYAQLRRGPAPACVTGDAPIELWRFYVARQWHGQGIAQELMRAVYLEARRAGASTLWLGVWERNERAKAFYRKCGFADVGSHIFVVGRDAQTDRILVRPVASAA